MKKNIFLSLLIFSVIAMILISPAKFTASAFNGISAWALYILPSVFPFMVFTKLLLNLGLVNKIFSVFSKPVQALYKTPSISSYVFFMSVLSGYPVGSKLIADLYEARQISYNDAVKMSSFCSNSGPMFIVGSVGASMLISVQAGFIILACHIISALLNGLLYRNIKLNSPVNTPLFKQPLNEIEDKSFSSVIQSSLNAILSVGGVVCVFFIIIECLQPIFQLFPESINSVLCGLVEITKGSLQASTLDSLSLSTTLCCFIITFGGLSTIFQAKTVLKKVNIPLWVLTLQKFTQALISVILCLILTQFFL